MAKRISINPSKRFLELYIELTEFLGLKDTYGETPKVLEFSMAFTLKTLHFCKKVLPYSFVNEIIMILSSEYPFGNHTSLDQKLERLKERP